MFACKKIVIFLVCFFIAAELSARIVSTSESWLMHKPAPAPFSSIQVLEPDGIHGLKYGQWNAIRLNKYGFYDSDDFTYEKRAGTVRIMCLGDSITFGTLTPPYNWPNYLEQLFKAQQLDAEVINASMPGNTFTQLVNLFETEYVKFHPDILIIYKGFRSYMEKPGFKYPIQQGPLIKLLRHSFFFAQQFDKAPEDPYVRLKKERKKRNLVRLVDTIPATAFERYRSDLLRLHAICRSNHIRLVVSPFMLLGDAQHYTEFLDSVYGALYYYPALSIEAYVHGTVQFNRMTKAIAERSGMQYVDISIGIEHNSQFFLDNVHLTPQGASTVAANYFHALLPVVAKQIAQAKIEASAK